MVQKSKAKNTKVEVKSYRDVAASINRFLVKNLHDRFSFTFSEKTKQKLVAYGPWLAAFALLIVAPELLVLAKDAHFISLSGFIEQILFNRTSWVLLLVLFANCLLTVDALSELFNKTTKGWNRVYAALLLNGLYIVYQLFANIEEPAAPLLSLVILFIGLFSLLDIRSYYK